MKNDKIPSSERAPVDSSVSEDWAWLDKISGELDEDVLTAALEQPEMQEREGLDELFR